MKVETLAVQDQLVHGYTHKINITFADLVALGAVANGTIQAIPLTGNAPVGTVVRLAKFDLITPFDFSDASINSLLVEVGDGTSSARFLAQTEVAADGTEILAAQSALAGALAVADNIKVKFTAAGGGSPTLGEATVGEINIYLSVRPGTPLTRA